VKKIHFNSLPVSRRKNDRKRDKNARIHVGGASSYRCPAPAAARNERFLVFHTGSVQNAQFSSL